MDKNKLIQLVRRNFENVKPVLHERGRRTWAASEAQQIGHGESLSSKRLREFLEKPFDEVCKKSNPIRPDRSTCITPDNPAEEERKAKLFFSCVS